MKFLLAGPNCRNLVRVLVSYRTFSHGCPFRPHIDALGLRALVDTILISEAEGLRKPDAALFLRAASRLDIEPDRCMFVGDNPVVDILGAHAAGMQTVFFRGKGMWPDEMASMPGTAIDALPDLLGLIEKS